LLVLPDAASWLSSAPKLMGIEVSGGHLVPVIPQTGTTQDEIDRAEARCLGMAISHKRRSP